MHVHKLHVRKQSLADITDRRYQDTNEHKQNRRYQDTNDEHRAVRVQLRTSKHATKAAAAAALWLSLVLFSIVPIPCGKRWETTTREAMEKQGEEPR